jgi:hypothetical protein
MARLYLLPLLLALGAEVRPANSSSTSTDNNGPTTTVALGPTTLSSGAPFGGVGGASGGGGGTRLLVDYPAQQRSDILDMLFKPLHGAALQHLKVEIGCDGDTTQGSEATHARSATDIDFDRGYEVWFMQEAANRRHDIQLSGLEWGIPGFVAADGMWSKTNVDYLTGWVAGLRDKKGLNITALAVAYNENTYDASFIKAVRKALDGAGLAHVRTIAPDSWGRMWAIVPDMQKDPALAAAIDIIGTHQECTGDAREMPPPGTMALGKPLWSTEQHIGEFGSFAGCAAGSTPQSMDLDLPTWDFRAALGLARALNQGYVVANQTSTLIWTPVYSWYETLLYGGKGIIVANSPWSGWYAVPDTVWMVAHTTQFVAPGWRFADSSGCRLGADNLSSVVSYVSPDSKNLSIVIETAQSIAPNTFEIQLSSSFAGLTSLHMWRSQRGAVFIKQPPLKLTKGAASLTIEPGSVVSLTTTTGQQKGGAADSIPQRRNFSLPYADNFESYADDKLPRFTSDMEGVYTARKLSSSKGGGTVLAQRTASKPESTATGDSTNFGTIIGDGSWIDYTVRITARITKEAGLAMSEIPASCTFNHSVGRCSGLIQQPTVNSSEACQAACCAKGPGCETWQWCPTTSKDCDKWKDSGRCWIGNADHCGSAQDNWVTGGRSKSSHPMPPAPLGPGHPWLYLASHIGVFAQGSSCILSGKPLPEICEPGGCCPIGKGGMAPAALHSSLSPAGFVFRLDFDGNGGSDASWSLQVGAPGGKCDGQKCNHETVSRGNLTWRVGDWMMLSLSAQRIGGNKTRLGWVATSCTYLEPRFVTWIW